MNSALDTAEITQPIIERDGSMGFIDNDILMELKHSIRTHLVIMASTSEQLCTYLVKVIDFFDDPSVENRNLEAAMLSFNIIEGIALHVQKFIDERIDRARVIGQPYPNSVAVASSEIMIAIGKSRTLSDKSAAKLIVLRSMADALNKLSAQTKAVYPQITDLHGNVL